MHQSSGETNAKTIQEGLEMILKQMEKVFKEQGLQAINPEGEIFDPLLHEAIATLNDGDKKPNTIVTVHEKGYKLWERIIRPAKVTVNKSGGQGTPQSAKGDEE